MMTPTQARDHVRRALKRGDIKRQPCEVCGTTWNIHAHHDDYEKPLDVRWLCGRHHLRNHGQKPKVFKKRKRYEGYEPETTVVLFAPTTTKVVYPKRKTWPKWWLDQQKASAEFTETAPGPTSAC
jgi:ribosomal protein S27AE